MNEDVIEVSESDDSCHEVDPVNAEDAMCIDDSVTQPLNQQRLRNSLSSFNIGESPNFTIAAATHSAASLDNGEMSRQALEQAREYYCQHLSCTCTNTGAQLLPVEGLKGIFHCDSCLSVHGIDDSMNYYDLLQKGDYMVEPCPNCGNTDPRQFCLEAGSTPDAIRLRCMKCCDVGQDNESVGGVEMAGEDDVFDTHIKQWIHYECKCNNSVSELMEMQFDSKSHAVFVKCLACDREDMVVLDFQPKVCTCKNSDNIDVRFDEYGYPSQLVCLKCQAEMDCGVSVAGDIPAGGDGTSTGRVRILSMCDLQIGDHIAWHQLLGYWHHAIVTEVNGARIRVVHYNGPNLPNKGTVH